MEITALRSSRTATKQEDAPVDRPALRIAISLTVLGGWIVIGLFALEEVALLEMLSWGVSLLALCYAIAVRFMVDARQRARLRLTAETAADSERRKISLDLHDGAIQPYLGLKLGLEALRRKAAADNPLAGDIDELYRMTQESIAELRGYVRVLAEGRQRAAALAEGLRRQIERFRVFYRLDVTLDMPPDLEVDERLAAELVSMVGEGLSNIGRHTDARKASIRLSSIDGEVVLHIADHGAGRADWRPFTPVSLMRRAERLRGRVEIAPQASGGTVVRIGIPI